MDASGHIVCLMSDRHYRPYAKMAAFKLFFCLKNEVSWAILNMNKRII